MSEWVRKRYGKSRLYDATRFRYLPLLCWRNLMATTKKLYNLYSIKRSWEEFHHIIPYGIVRWIRSHCPSSITTTLGLKWFFLILFFIRFPHVCIDWRITCVFSILIIHVFCQDFSSLGQNIFLMYAGWIYTCSTSYGNTKKRWPIWNFHNKSLF